MPHASFKKLSKINVNGSIRFKLFIKPSSCLSNELLDRPKSKLKVSVEFALTTHARRRMRHS